MKPGLGRMPFGKYQDKLLIDIAEDDPQYLYWLIEQEWLKPSLLRNVQLALKLETLPDKSVRGRPLQLIIDKVKEALFARGWSKGEAEQMIRRLMEANPNGKK
jgi:uncharacterized protein (DUF3820 family)